MRRLVLLLTAMALTLVLASGVALAVNKASALLPALIHRSAWKGNSANFAFWLFSEVRRCYGRIHREFITYSSAIHRPKVGCSNTQATTGRPERCRGSGRALAPLDPPGEFFRVLSDKL